MYVWFEAVMGYYSASVHWAKNQGKPEEWKKWWENEDSNITTSWPRITYLSTP